MDSLKAAYIEEANELLANLEIALLGLENNPTDKSYIEQVFRVMHTLKGNSSMFGLSIITDFVHDLESIYDRIRNGEMALEKDLLNCTLASLDHLRLLVYDPELEKNTNREKHEELIKRITEFIETSNNTQSAENLTETISNDENTVFHIYFEPNASIFSDGSNPLFLVNEIADMGKTKVIPHFKAIQSIDDYNPTDCICYWDIFLETKMNRQNILDVFVFVESNSIIEINELPFVELIKDTKFNEITNTTQFRDTRVNLSEIVELAEPVETKNRLEDEYNLPVDISDKVSVSKKVELKEKSIASIRVASDKLDELMNLVSELVTTQASLSLYTESNRMAELEAISENVEKLSRRLRDIAFGMTLVPINNMFGRFQRMVRDISNQLNKEVEFVTEGGETELDKSIIDTLSDPLMHIIRNCLDHGIESTEQRIKSGKRKQGKVLLKAYYSGVFVYIQISDDGRGLDTEAIRLKAIQKGIIKNDDMLTEKDIYNLIFYPGFSTAQAVTDISGRGVGMDVVKRNIADLKGEILIHSIINEGTTLTIKLPLTLSIIDGLLVGIDDVKYIIPLSVVIKCYEVNNRDMLNNFNKLLLLDGEQIPFINLREVFGHTCEPDSISQLIVVSNGEDKVGVSVDFIVGEYQAVIKPLGKYYKNQDFVSGATILGDGTIALVLDTRKIVQLYTKNIKMEEHV